MPPALNKILLVDDEERLLNSMAQRLALLGIEATRVSSGTDAIRAVEQSDFDLAIVDLKMPDMDGLMTITRLKEISPALKTVLLTGYGNEAIQKQADQLEAGYFEKDAMTGLWDLIKALNTDTQDNTGVDRPEAGTAPPAPRITAAQDNRSQALAPLSVPLPRIIGQTTEMQQLRKDIRRLSELDCTVLLQGENGTGKELTARTIHSLSSRKHQRFLAFNCGCFSSDFHFEELLSSLEIPDPSQMPHQDNSKTGFIGTILLDHFEVMPEATQIEMIHIMNQVAKNRAGKGPFPRRDIRFMLATHTHLKQKVDTGGFSPDLYKKLNAIEVSVPPLRQRQEDIYPLCIYLLQTLNTAFDKQVDQICDTVLKRFAAYDFPGNVRELKHILERAVILARDNTIELSHLPERLASQSPAQQANSDQKILSLGELEKHHIRKVLETTGNNKSKACEILGISRAALWRKLKLMDGE